METKNKQAGTRFDVAVIGASLGGVQAAISAAEHGYHVYLCEPTKWIGGQLTSQAVPPDEHPWIEECGATQKYRRFREDVRKYYRNAPHASDKMKKADKFCPGGSWVSRVAHDPRVALHILTGYLQPHMDAGRIELELETRAVCAVVKGRNIVCVGVQNDRTGDVRTIEAAYFLDATDCGDLLPIVGAQYRTGAESKEQTGEPHAAEKACAEDMQPCTWVAALELCKEEPEPLERPALYDLFRLLKAPYDDDFQLSWYGPNCTDHKKTRFYMFDGEDPIHCGGLWSYRRIVAADHYTDGRNEVTLFNWPQNDYAFGNVFDDPHAQQHREMAKELTRCAVYWLRYDAPRPDGGTGYPVRYCPEYVGSDDGLALAPYIRESRRIVARGIVREQDVTREQQDGILHRTDSVGVGSYAIDLHPTTRTHTYFYTPTWPFEIPLSAMIPIDFDNLLPACKNIGCTHLTNGCFRLHPVEWNIGEAAGHLAAFCLEKNVAPSTVLDEYLEEFQTLLQKSGVALHWEPEKMKGL